MILETPNIKVLSLTLIPQRGVTKPDLLTKVLVDYCMWSLAVLHNLEISGDSFAFYSVRPGQQSWLSLNRFCYSDVQFEI